MRLAIYWAPARSDPLFHLGNQWLGRNPATNAPVPQPAIRNIEAITADARHYGFHCTLRPPMRLATSEPAFHATAQQIAADTAAFPLPPLRVSAISGFLALTLVSRSLEMQALANLCVRATNPHRAPPSPEELARRRAAGLTPRQEILLQSWGYPYVMEEWFCHLTLSRRLSQPEMETLLPQAHNHFAGALTAPRHVTEICVFNDDAGRFRITRRYTLQHR